MRTPLQPLSDSAVNHAPKRSIMVLCFPVWPLPPDPSLHTPIRLDHPPTMDASELPKVTLDPDGRVQGDTSGDTSDSPDCLLVRPTREALDYLEQALTTGIPQPNYDGPIPRPIMASGRYPIDMVFTLPLEAPFHITQSTSPLVRLSPPNLDLFSKKKTAY